MTNRRMYHNIVINYLFTCSQHTFKVWVGPNYKAHTSSGEWNMQVRAKQKLSKVCWFYVEWYYLQSADTLSSELAFKSLGVIRKRLKPTKHPRLVSDQTSSGSNFWDQSRWIILQARHKGALEYPVPLGGRSGVFMRADVYGNCIVTLISTLSHIGRW